MVKHTKKEIQQKRKKDIFCYRKIEQKVGEEIPENYHSIDASDWHERLTGKSMKGRSKNKQLAVFEDEIGKINLT